MKPLVSISIPTYNRAYLLKNTLDMLCKQIDEGQLYDQVEIVISDNASSDDTQEVVSEFISTNKFRINYHRNTVNLGVIRNILKLVELTNAKYWMFYGDDDVVPNDALPNLVKCLECEDLYPVYMFNWPQELRSKKSALDDWSELSIEELASKFFYHVGNAGIFAVHADTAKAIVRKYEGVLIKTCWPQTIIIFLAMNNSNRKKALYRNITTSIPPKIPVLKSNAYYLFETGLYSLVRTALYIENIINIPFCKFATLSIDGVVNFKQYKISIFEGFCFFDNPKQKEDLKSALREAHETIPVSCGKEIRYLYNEVVNKGKIFLIFRLYIHYLNSSLKRTIQTTYLKRLLILSPWGYYNNILMRKREIEACAKEKFQLEVDMNSGYF